MFFRKYNIVIFKDREAGFHNLRLRGWLGLVFFLAFIALAALNIYLWQYFNRAVLLEYELAQAQNIIQGQNTQLLTLAAKVESVETNLSRVQQFDTKLRVLMNIGKDSSNAEEEEASSSFVSNPALLSQHRNLFARRMHSLVNDLTEQIFLEEINQQTLLHLLHENKDALLATPSIWPAQGFLTSGFGNRRNPFTNAKSFHAGLDIANSAGTPVVAPARGTIIFSAWDGAYGNCIIVDHGNGITTRYAHLQRSVVSEKQSVQRGDVLGHVGSTGRSTGPHLHYEVRVNGVLVDPKRYILD